MQSHDWTTKNTDEDFNVLKNIITFSGLESF